MYTRNGRKKQRIRLNKRGCRSVALSPANPMLYMVFMRFRMVVVFAVVAYARFRDYRISTRERKNCCGPWVCALFVRVRLPLRSYVIGFSHNTIYDAAFIGAHTQYPYLRRFVVLHNSFSSFCRCSKLMFPFARTHRGGHQRQWRHLAKAK